MPKNTSKKKGMIKIEWKDIRDRVLKVEPHFTKIVDELNPDKSFPLFLAYYPYGAIDADTQSSFFPDDDGNYYRISDKKVPKEVLLHLGYSKNDTPLAMVLDKQIECFIDLKNQKITIPWLIYTPGKIFPFSRILNKTNGRICAPNGLLSSAAGVRSTFMLPNIGCAAKHSNLQRDFNIKQPSPKHLYDHWSIFKEIVNSEIVNSDWRCCVMYFSQKWIDKIQYDSSWCNLKHYLQELAWNKFEYEIHRIDYDMIFSIIQQNRNLKPNPYLADTAKHLFVTAVGSAPGYAPALDDSALPLSLLQNIFIESYGLKKYIPTVIQPMHFDFDADLYPIYYSLHIPSTHVFSPKSRRVSSILHDIRELDHILQIFLFELSKKDGLCSSGSFINNIANQAKFKYFHNKQDRHRIITLSSEADKFDKRFLECHEKNKIKGATFASDAPFMRGCISISV